MCEWNTIQLLLRCHGAREAVTVHCALMTHGRPSKHGPPGSSSSSQSHVSVSPSGRSADTLTLWRTKVFSQGFPLHVQKYQSRRIIGDDILSCDVEESGKCDAFMRADGACTSPHRYNAICLWLAVIERDNHPISHGKMPCSNYVFVQFLKGCNQSQVSFDNF